MKIRRMECTPIEKGNVILVEPNCVNINNDIVNGIPQYQDMYIFAELTAKSKGRTVIIKDSNATSTDSKTINFIGNNQDNDNPDNPNYLNFTTNYYDGSTAGGTHYEGFGMNNIKITINSSFIPQVNIQFVDIRGLAFFNQQDSPYRILFDFPPPIFTLTVKGYYGNSITYELHLVKYTSEFNAGNGNFVIDAQFVAVTFAPLADILFRYVVNAPLITNNDSMSPSTGERPANTYDLIMKLKNLYAAITDKLDTDTENKELTSTQNQLVTLDEISDIFRGVIENQNEILGEGVYLVARTPKDETEYNVATSPATRISEKYNLQIIRTLPEFNAFIKDEETTGIKNTLENRLYVAYIVGTNLPVTEDDYVWNRNNPNYSTPLDDPYEFPTKNYTGFKTKLSAFGKSLFAKNIPSFNVKEGDIGNPQPFTNGINITTNDEIETEYYGMDVTDYYYKLYKKNQQLVENQTELSGNLAVKINNMVSQTLGMTPTIYNVFEIILNDVDEFFRILRKTSRDADYKHNNPAINKRIISSNNIDSPVNSGNIPDHIYPFPLIIKESPVHGGLKKERIAPIELSKKVPFPELDLVSDFMDTFVAQRNTAELYDARRNQNDDGSFKWIPTSPLDSALGGASPQSPYLNINDAVRPEFTKIFLKRFYMLSQGSIDDIFYGESETKRNAYLNLYANAEAINVITTLNNKQTADTLEIMAKQYKNNVQAFYDYAKTIPDEYDNGTDIVKGDLIDFPNNDPKYFPITPSNPSDGKVYVDKFNDDFVGFNWYTNDVVIQERTETEGSSKPVDNFNEDAKTKWFKRNDAEYLFFEFTQENVIYLRDIDDSDGVSESQIKDGLNTFTRYLTNDGGEFRQRETVGLASSIVPNGNFPGSSADLTQRAIEGQKIAYRNGNSSFNDVNAKDKKALKYGDKPFGVWVQELLKEDVVETLTGTSTQNLSTVLILSNYGTTASPFNIYPNASNSLIFDTPAAVEVPEFYAPYIGALLTAIEPDDGGTPWVDEILEYFTGTTGDNGIGASSPNKGFMVLADLHDVDAYLSKNDKDKFKQAYRDYSNNQHGDIVRGIIDMCDYVRENSAGDGSKMFLSESVGYNYLLNPESTSLKGAQQQGQFYWIIENLFGKKTLVNFSQLTFEMTDTYSAGYTPISLLQEDTQKNSANQKFFELFFSRLEIEIKKKYKDLKEEEEVQRKAKGDEDIINQLYYSFKNINDKWLTGTANDNEYYPFNKLNKKLIDSFAFVDRGMNPIGDTVINAEVLIDMMDNPNISLFSVLSQLLSLNGFEFFPLQNFMNFSGGTAWEDSFKIHTGAIEAQNSTAFVCMYIGGTSSYPSVSGNGFENDGIIDITEPGVTDYFTKKPQNQNTVNDSMEENNTDFPWRQVRAFRVRFGEQNQSMFTDIKIDSKEYPETNESIQILSRLAGDNNPSAPVPKGQNLYNLYENRSYKATVTGFGNAMIQPTQYFQLENIPLFNGAYIILDVEHNITANKMMTSFSGTKLLKYPVPRVLNPVAFTNLNPTQTPGEVVIAAANVVSEREETHFYSMYDNTSNSLKIE